MTKYLKKGIIFFTITLFFQSLLFAGSIAVRNIQVDVKGKTALDARETALIKARQLAFSKFVSENPSFGFDSAAGMPADHVLENLVDDYEILREKMSNVRYIGTFNINFNDRALKKYLANPHHLINPLGAVTKESVTGLKSSNKRYLIIPVYIGADSSYLWEENNPWSRHWVAYETKTKGKVGAHQYTVPLGDLRDLMALTIEDAMTSKSHQITALIERYGAEGALVTILKSLDDGMNSHELQVKKFTRVGLEQAHEPLTLQGQRGVTLEDIFKTAVRHTFNPDGGKEEVVEARESIQETRDTQEPIETPQESSSRLQITAKFDTFQDWQAIRQALSRNDFIDTFDVLNLNRQQANLHIKSRLPEAALKARLTERGLRIEHFGGKTYLSLANPARSINQPLQRIESPFTPQPLHESDDFSQADVEDETLEPPEVIE